MFDDFIKQTFFGADDAPDSFNQLSTLRGAKLEEPVRDHLLTQAGNFQAHALRRGPWKLIVPAGAKMKPELYNLADDPAETKNRADAEPDRAKAMTAELQRIRQAGRTRTE